MSIAPIQLLKVDGRANLYAGLDNQIDKYIMIAAFDGTTGTTPNYTNTFAKGCFLFHLTDGTSYQNSAASGAAPTWNLYDVSAGGLPALGDGKMWVGNVGNVATPVTMTGDVTITNAGVATILSAYKTNVDAGDPGVNDDSAAGYLIGSLWYNTTSGRFFTAQDVTVGAAVWGPTVSDPTLASANILVGDAGNIAQAVAMSGDVAINNTGVTTVLGVNGFAVNTAGIQNTAQTFTGTFMPLGAPEAQSGPGALDPSSYQTQFTSTGAGDALSLADGTIRGQLKKVSYIAEGGAGDTGIITPTTPLGFATVTLNAIGDYVVFMWLNGLGWRIVDSVGVTVA